MEPRPPRPRSSAPGQPGASYGAAGGRPPASGGDPYTTFSSVPPVGGVNPADIDLVSRGERRRRGVLRALGTLALLAAIVGGLWWFRDRLPSVSVNPPAQQQAATVPGTPAAPATQPPTTEVAMTEPTPAVAAPTTRPAVASVLATATATPKPAPKPTTAPVEVATVPAAPKPTTAPAPAQDANGNDIVRLIDLLPTEAEMPNGLALTNQGERSKSDVVAALGGTDEASQLLDDWGWQGNAFREFTAPDGADLPDGATVFVNVSVHRFASPEAADNALTYFSDQVVNTQGLTDFQVEPVGDATRALQGSPDGLPLVVLYVRKGSTMYRIGGSANSAAGDPTPDVVAVAQAAVAK